MNKKILVLFCLIGILLVAGCKQRDNPVNISDKGIAFGDNKPVITIYHYKSYG